MASVEQEIFLASSSIGIQSTQPFVGQTKLTEPETVEIGVTSGVREGVIVIAGVGVVIGTSVPGIGRKRAATIPMRIPKRTRAMTIKKVFRKPDFLDDKGISLTGRGDFRGVSWYIGGEIDSGLVGGIGKEGFCVGDTNGGVGSLLQAAGGVIS